MKAWILATGASVAAIAIAIASPAQAQLLGDDENVIIVTAQKKEKDLQDVPVSVTAFNGDALASLGIETSAEIVAQVPGLSVGTPVGEGNNPSFTLRGVGLNDFNDNNEGPIAIYIDDVYQAALPGLTFQLFDTERVEVLRGPQGTLYGRNATGGLIQFISRRPTDTFDGYVTGEYSEFDTFRIEGAVGGPLGESVRVRLSTTYSNSEGYVFNRLLEDRTNQLDAFAMRLQFEFDLGPDTRIGLKGFFSDNRVDAPQYQHQATLGATGADNLPFCPTDVPRDIFCYADVDGDAYAGAYDRRGVLDISARGIHATLDHDFGGVKLTNVFGWQETDKRHEEDTDVGPFPGIEPTFTSNIEAFTNELRLSGDLPGGIDFQVGGFYLNTRVRSANDLLVQWRGDFANLLDSDPAVFDGALSAFNGPIPNTPDLIPAILFDVNYLQETESWAGFAEIDWQVSDTISVIAGIRYTDEARDFDYVNAAPAGPLLNNVLQGLGEANYFSVRPGAVNGFAAALGAGPADVVAAEASRLREDSFVGRVTLNVEPADDLLLYAGWSRGFKAGGFNAGFLDQTDFIVSDNVKFGAETLDSFEGGVKWTAPGNAIRVNAAAFYYDYKNLQALTFQGLSQFITNADASFYGAEVELGLRPVDGLDAQFGVSYLETDVDGVTVQGVTLDNRSAVLAPRFTANGFVRYGKPVGKGELSGSVSFNYQSEHFFDITNSPNSRQGAYAVVGARIGYEDDSGWRIAVFGDNLFDEEYLVYTFDFTGPGGFNQRFFGRPQWFGVSAGVDF
ncbi:TonB-dependent receptor [Porphyrobacter sp. TH134]|uniref:TonB-dependent receptor n=1 Tax=Porphyrobacter sp. TH134 TaxID=2067450 RepID=UPI001552376C|nr:TonB-dependent receptor [Porphyrobacter sp. TH134]